MDNITTYVFIDTNIFVRYLSQGKEGCEPEHWHRIVAGIQSEAIKLLIPEIVQLELEKQAKTIPQEAEAKLKHARDQIQKQLQTELKFTEIQDIQLSVLKEFDRLYSQKLHGIQERYQSLASDLSHKNAIAIPLDLQILLLAKKRQLAGRLAISSKPNDADCGIIESLIHFFRTQPQNNAQILFCSENTNDFALFVGDEKKWVLDKSVGVDLPPSEYFTNLRLLADFVESNGNVTPPNQAVVDAAQEKLAKKRINRLVSKYHLREMKRYDEFRLDISRRLQDLLIRKDELDSEIVRLEEQLLHIEEEWKHTPQSSPLSSSLKEQYDRLHSILDANRKRLSTITNEMNVFLSHPLYRE